MKVTYLYRPLRPGGFSIEEVFSNVRKHVTEPVQQAEWFVNGAKGLPGNIKDVAKIRSDIFHITGDCNYLALNLPPARTILTVHDVGHYEITLKGWRKQVYKALWWKLPLSRVKTITAISGFTKKRLVANFGIVPDKIKVIYDPAPVGFFKDEKKLNRSYPRILQIGSGINKNLDRLIDAVEGLPCKLVLVNRLNDELKHKLREKKIDFEQHVDLSRDEMITQYRQCDIVYFASLYEGFGLPIVEAQTIGRPVITSNICSMPEIAGDGAIIINPYNVNDIRKAITDFVSSDTLADDIVDRGFDNVRRFAPEKIAKDYMAIYQSLV